MTKRILLWGKYPLLVLLLGFAAYGYDADKNKKEHEREEIIAGIVHNALMTSHFSPPTIDLAFADSVFETYLESIDYNKRMLTMEDVLALKAKSINLKSEIENGKVDFFNFSYDIIQERLKAVPELYSHALENPFDFEEEVYFETDDEKRDWPMDETELQKQWVEYCKFRVLNRLYEMQNDQKKALDRGDTLDEVKSFAQMEEEARKKELDFQKEWHENYDELDRSDWFGMYINSITNNFDPHTEYYPPQQKEDFEIEMSGQFEGIGAQLMVKGEYVVIDKVVTGSASWKQGDLEVGDKILAVAEEGEEAVDVVGMSIRKVVKLIRGKKGTTVILTVRKLDGSREDIPIVRDVVELEATFARSAVVEEDGKRIGYIRLPKFYVDFYNETNRDCAEDVRKEIEYLRKEEVEGIILDLRNNGGGTLDGVVNIAGLFIEEGPIVQVQASGFSPRILKDRDREIHYDGPLVVMTNAYSASASEIFAAAMQDYKRGVIMGSRSTFGKGTVQNVGDLDRMAGSRYNDFKPLGALKLTVQKFYRINGGTPQLRGVKPDIVFPDQFLHIDFGEKDRKNAMEYSEIKPTSYKKWPVNEAQLMGVIDASRGRIDESELFSKVNEYALWLKEQREETQVPLQYEAFANRQKMYKQANERFKDIFKNPDALSVRLTGEKQTQLESAPEDLEEWIEWAKNVGEDLQISEAVRVAIDLGKS